GQAILLTGPVGGSLLGRHLRIEPRIELGRLLFEAGATAMMDVSDGLAWDLFRLARTSRVRFEVQEVPVHRDARRRSRLTGSSALWHALHDGEDHELIATLPQAAWARLELRGLGLHRIGSVRKGSGLLLSTGSDPGASLRTWRPDRDRGGWRHGQR
ncbi:MAG: thiamine-monophosphate kinase, partial [Planctomycetota bacterium]